MEMVGVDLLWDAALIMLPHSVASPSVKPPPWNMFLLCRSRRSGQQQRLPLHSTISCSCIKSAAFFRQIGLGFGFSGHCSLFPSKCKSMVFAKFDWRTNIATSENEAVDLPAAEEQVSLAYSNPDSSAAGHLQLVNGVEIQQARIAKLQTETCVVANDDSKSSQRHKCKEVLRLFKNRKMEEALGLLESLSEVDEWVVSIYEQLLLDCCKFQIVAVAQRLHAIALRYGFMSNFFIGNCFISSFSKLGMMRDAQIVFDGMPVRNSTSWNELIIGYARHGSHEEATKLYNRMKVEGFELSELAVVLMLNSCGSTADIPLGQQLQAEAMKRGFDTSIFVGTALVNMYTKLDDLKTAYQIFKNMPDRSAVTWHVMIYAYAKSGNGRKALELYQQMKKEGVKPSDSTFIYLLKYCESLANLELGNQIHADIIESGIQSTVYLGTTLVHMYAKCGSLDKAQEIFNKMPSRNEVSFATMIAAYRKKQKNKEVIRCYMDMRREHLNPHPRTLISVIHACCINKALEEGRQVHDDVIKLGYVSDASVITALVDMYCKCRQLRLARELFDNMPRRNVAIYTCIISAYARNYAGEEALRLYDQMRTEGLVPVLTTFIFVLNACASTRNLERGKRTHKEITEAGLELHVTVGSAVVDMYAKCGSLADAQEVFDRMPAKNEYTWTSLIAGYARNKSFEEAFKLYRAMKLQGLKPDVWTFVCVLNVCVQIGSLEYGKEVHEDIRKSGCEADATVSKALAYMYSKCERSEALEAQLAFQAV